VSDRARATTRSSSHGDVGVGLFDLDTVWIAVGVFVPAIVSMVGTIGAVDLSYHIRAGEHLLSTGHILDVDTFTFTATGQPWLNQQWGAQALLAVLYRAGGFATLSFARAIAMMLIAWLLFLTCRARGADRRTAGILTAVALCLSLPALGVRPQLFGLLLFALALWILMTRTEHPARLWALPLVAAAWANLHGSFLFLPLIVGLCVVDSTIRKLGDVRRLVLIGAVSMLATLVNPYGVGVWTYVVDLTTNPIVRTWITEWEPISIRDPFGVVFFSSVLLIVGYLARRGHPTPWVDLLWLAVFFVAAAAAIRSLAWWGFVAPVVMAGVLPTTRTSATRRGSPRLNAVFLASFAVAALLLLPWRRDVRLILAPQGLARGVADATAPGARLFVVQPYASWFEFELPDRPVFVDSRIEIFPESIWHQYDAVTSGRADWQAILDRWDVDAVVTEDDTEVLRFLRTDPGWSLVTKDEDGFVFVRA
jgi:hypothetical protein